MTTPTKHSPGPWLIIHEPTLNTYHIRVEDLDAAPIASLFYSSGGSRPQLSRELIDANARLIAAAPDLLIQLEQVESEFSRTGTLPVEALPAIRRTLAKTKVGAS